MNKQSSKSVSEKYQYRIEHEIRVIRSMCDAILNDLNSPNNRKSDAAFQKRLGYWVERLFEIAGHSSTECSMEHFYVDVDGALIRASYNGQLYSFRFKWLESHDTYVIDSVTLDAPLGGYCAWKGNTRDAFKILLQCYRNGIVEAANLD